MATAKPLQCVDRKGPSISPALSRGLRLLRVFSDAPVWLSNSDIAGRTDLPAATVARLTKSLAGMGLLHYSSSRRRFRLAPGVVRLGYGVRSEIQIIELIRPHLQEVANRYRVHTALAVLDGIEALHVEVCHSTATLVTLRLEAGSRVSVAGSPVGHALLAGLEPAQRHSLMRDLARHHGAGWDVMQRQVEQGLGEIAGTGFTLSLGGWHPDIHGVAVPLKPSGQPAIMSLGCCAHRGQMPVPRLKELGKELVRLASTLTSTRASA
ncbi:IclR family transcriptional regulator [Nitratireductor kimnyeongensis]|uniref:IclR family transcriptional regulator n=1 Tax=Nitratireductor kimnyeongensis TaxID=430679 RepID=A0ABW0TA33_9HYPH|nr:helix-turn-helix domain-containing protein [Nitratireductor kimnyeongensis]QZZ36559.1 helix-turn-helix domain-containing protein [Nitratireductor kimnyeongensis]